MSYKIDKFFGLAPRANPLASGHSRAQIALDVDLDNGTLRPWRTPKQLHQADHDILSFACVDGCWLTFPTCTSIVYPFIPSCPFVILGAEGRDFPRIATVADACLGDFCRLGVPCPPTAPVMSFTPITTNKKTVARAYRYTYVNRYGQEGGGSLPSEVVNIEDGQSVTVQGWTMPEPEWCVVAIRIYRLGTPFETGMEESNPPNSEYYFVAEIPVTQGSYVDTIPDIALGGDGRANVFTNDEWLPAPSDLRGIVTLENGILAGISGEYVYLSDPLSPHAWNLRYIKGLLDKPLGLGTTGNGLYILTDGRPYFMDGRNNPKQDGYANVLRTRVPVPLIAPRSIASDSNACYYASTDGLAMIVGKEVKIASQTLLSERDWQDLQPNSMIGAVRKGYYHGYTAKTGVRFRTIDPEHAKLNEISYTNISERPTALWAGDNGELYYAQDRNILGWNLGDRMRDYTWQQTADFFPRRTGFTSASVSRGLPGNLRWRLESDYGIVQDRMVNKTQEFRTPGLSNAEFTAITLSGTAEVRQVALGTSIISRMQVEGGGRAAA